MPVFGFECLQCGHQEPAYAPTCPACKSTMSAVYESPETRERERQNKYMFGSVRSRSTAQHFEPIVYHVRADGHVSIPGRGDVKPNPMYERREARTIREIEALERRVNRQELDKCEHAQHQTEMERAMLRQQTRPGLRQQMQHWSPAGRAFAEATMRHYDQRPNRLVDPGVHVEVLAFDQSNREGHEDRRTGWKSRRG